MYEQEREISGGASLSAPVALSAKLLAAEKCLSRALSQVEGNKRGQREGGRAWASLLRAPYGVVQHCFVLLLAGCRRYRHWYWKTETR